ncbi:hypothetical protein [Nonomuraea sp. NEAU-A123]|uniref:hypothetical protein n=1 Tax=Nonomuraea sp. NEAU-A123 TaxID=2839649 RepID=UPI001BE45208|nr:hypothetical protein [Nonomuraea sp. NEAU-A123]MBT2232244.1 hypothetical protein [Nonomuraea sp. NEAU-A123]
MMRIVAGWVLVLYPPVWRRRYGEEVRDLLDSRPVRLRTVLDLARGATDAWLHRERVPGAKPLLIPLPLVLPITSYGLLSLWNPGVRDVPSLYGVWAMAADTGALAEALETLATSLFIVAGGTAILSAAPLLITSLAVLAGRRLPVTRGTALGVIATALLLVLPIWLFCQLYYQLVFADAGFPVGPLGDAMTGGFFAPIVIALVLPLSSVAAYTPALGPGVRNSAGTLAVAAGCNMAAWLPVALLLLLGLPQASPGFVVAVTASALVSGWMGAVVARRALRQGRTATQRLSLS